LGCSAKDTLWVIDCLSMDEITSKSFNIYPNPSDQILTIQSNSDSPLTIHLRTLSGQLLMEKRISANETMQLNTEQFANELYLLEIFSDKQIWHEKLLILHH
jgi:hypothetical protein